MEKRTVRTGHCYYKKGDWAAICDCCLFRFHASDLRKQWDGQMVCKDCFEERHPQDSLRPRPERNKLPWTRPEPESQYITVDYSFLKHIEGFKMSQCVGGTESVVNGYKVHTFLSSGNLIVNSNVFVEILVVAGGGSGGGGTGKSFEGGGGGAGGLIHVSGYELSPGVYPVIVGNGGVGGKVVLNNGNNGEDSVFDALTAVGGGKGGVQSPGHDGGSGGGGTYWGYIGGSGTPEQGNNGGAHVGNLYGFGGGGGGAGQAGNTSGAGQGGDGLSFDISGSLVFYAGGGGGIVSTHSFPDGIGHGGKGGGGTAYYGAGAGENGVPNTGGGGAGSHIDDNIEAGDGGSGIIIIKYLSTDLSVIV